MILDGEDRLILEAQAGDGVVVQIDLGDDRAAALQVFALGGETVVLGGDGHAALFGVLDGLVAAAVAELQLVGRSADGVRDDLVTETDAEDRVGLDEIGHGFVGILQGGGVAGAVGQEDAVGVEGADLGGRGAGREDVDVEAGSDEAAEDGGLGTEVIGRDAELGGATLRLVEVRARDGEGLAIAGLGVEVIRSLAGDVLDEVGADGAGPGAGTLEGFFVGDAFGREAGLHHAGRTQLLGQRAGVDAFDAGDAILREPGAQVGGGAPVGDDGRKVADDETSDVRAGGFEVVFIDAVVPDLRCRQYNRLAAVGGVGEDLLIPGHVGREDYFRHGRRDRSDESAEKKGSVLEEEEPLGRERVHASVRAAWQVPSVQPAPA